MEEEKGNLQVHSQSIDYHEPLYKHEQSDSHSFQYQTVFEQTDLPVMEKE